MSVPAKDSSRRSESELLIAIAAGNRRALEDLYLGYQRRLAAFLTRFTQRRENLEEIINDTFMVVWQNASDFRGASQVSSWIFGIAYRTALKSIRRQKKHTATRSFDECLEQTVDPMLETEFQDWVMHGLNRLPNEQRSALELAYHMGHSLMEIAEITGAPIGTVKARMFHARQNLRQYLPILGDCGTSRSVRPQCPTQPSLTIRRSHAFAHGDDEIRQSRQRKERDLSGHASSKRQRGITRPRHPPTVLMS
jgi:RNA polymerase sigma-70 factor (ECF subfamily)